MAEAPAKLPLAIRRDVRDNEERKSKLLADASTQLGSLVTFNFDLEATYNNLSSSNYQARVVSISLNYLEQVIKALFTTYKDVLVKQEFESAWTTHNIALVVPTSAEWEQVKADKTTVGGSYFRLRLLNGELQTLASPQYFNSNLNDIGGSNLTTLASAASAQASAGTPGAPEELPLEIRQKMRDVQGNVDASLAKIRKLKGLEDASFDVDKQTRVCYSKLQNQDRQKAFSPAAFSEYLDQLSSLLAKQMADDMMAEALLDEWTAPHIIELQPETDLAQEKGAKVVKALSYNAIKLENGKLLMLQGKGHWRTNMSQIADIDLVKMF